MWQWFNRLDSVMWLAVGMAIVGLASLIAGAVRGLVRRRHGQRLRPSAILLIIGCLLIGGAGWQVARRPAALGLLFQGDLDDAARLQHLQTVADDHLQRPRALPGLWPQWRGPHRDGVSDEIGWRTSWDKTLPIAWRQPIGGGYGSFAVADGQLFVLDRQGDSERVVCLDAETGRERWAYAFPADYGRLSQGYATGPRSTPTVTEGRVYALGALGQLVCLEEAPADGKPHLLWQHDLIREFGAPLPAWGMACSPLVDGGQVVVQPGGKDHSVAAFDTVSGKLLWSALSDPPGYSSPVLATVGGIRQIVCFTGSGLAGLRAGSGEQLWYFPWRTQFDANIATPIVAGNYVFISSDYGAGCALIELSADGAGMQAAPVYIKRNKIMRNKHSCSVLYRGYIYGFDVTGGSVLKCVDLRTGAEKWASRKVRHGSLLAADGHLLILSENGALSLVAATPDGFKLETELPGAVRGSQCWAMPVLAAGRLYLRGEEQLLCLDLRRQ